jgi:hypothetical protein
MVVRYYRPGADPHLFFVVMGIMPFGMYVPFMIATLVILLWPARQVVGPTPNRTAPQPPPPGSSRR